MPGFAYSIGRKEDETYCLVQESDGWRVFSSERGVRRTEKQQSLAVHEYLVKPRELMEDVP
jgi:hypothetical protein